MAQSNFFVVTGAEGSGKSTIIDKLENILPFYRINYIAVRDIGEKGMQKVDWQKFQELAENDSFILSFKKRDTLVGVTYAELNQARSSGKPIIWEIDLKWLNTIKNEYPEAQVILVNGLGVEDLYQHFESKGHAVPAAMAIMAKRADTLNKWSHEEVDYIVENKKDQSDKAAEEIKKIITGNYQISSPNNKENSDVQ